ncbi:hypothetical protein SeLEV6574_g07627 [Synchytrium endobioticum]|uniref:RNA polymerase II transcription factor B subunit 2 n=1 Tax=Synchytrium endobioticum TaxID=286115 RepID=A0A507CKI4_9FUNG|nr:hypothetical protein SeLEV6574_g07627 [Synchytrium endobioticum]
MEVKQADIWTWLKEMPPTTRGRVYSEPASALAVLRLLPEPCRHLVLKLLYVQSPIPAKVAANWFYDQHVNTKLKEAIRILRNLYILIDPPSSGAAPAGGQKPAQELKLKVNEIFQNSLHKAITMSGETNSFGKPPESVDKHATSITALDEYSQKQWEAVLHFLVGTPIADRDEDGNERNDEGLEMLMVKSGLMVKGYDGLHITNSGFAFLLQDLHVQVWGFLVHYLEMCQEMLLEAVEVLHLILTLSSLRLGQDYSTESLTVSQKQALRDFRPLGLVYQRKSGSKRFYPTRMATTLVSGTRITDKPPSDSGFIMLETNYRVYAYTSSPLQISILGLFVQLKARFSNMVVGVIDRNSVKRALENGITANQIVSYLQSHAHPEMMKQAPVLPPTVVDQIRLWEQERSRLRMYKGRLYSGFATTDDWRQTCEYAHKLGSLLWSNETARQLFVAEEGHNLVKQYLGKRKQQ